MKLWLLLICFFVYVESTSISRVRRDTSPDEVATEIENEILSVVDSMQGGTCLSDKNCLQFVSYCEKENIILPGTCQLNWWVWILLGVVVFLMIVCCCACICCQCCLCYACCSAILDVLCCCCRNKGYSPANSG